MCVHIYCKFLMLTNQKRQQNIPFLFSPFSQLLVIFFAPKIRYVLYMKITFPNPRNFFTLKKKLHLILSSDLYS